MIYKYVKVFRSKFSDDTTNIEVWALAVIYILRAFHLI